MIPDNYYLINTNCAEWEVFEEFKAFDLRNNGVVIKNTPQVTHRITSNYPFYRIEGDYLVYDQIENYGNKTFKIGSLELEYYRGWKDNREASNNRGIEVALANWFRQKYNDDIIEVGDVSCKYEGYNGHKVLDPYGPFPNSIRKDVLDYSYQGLNVVSVSTWEHFSESAYGNNDSDKPVKALQKINSEAKNWLITFDIGADRHLEDWVMNQNEIKYTFIVRDNFRGLINNWTQSGDKNNFYLPYLHFEYCLDYYGNAAAICVLSNQLELFV